MALSQFEQDWGSDKKRAIAQLNELSAQRMVNPHDLSPHRY